MEDSHLGSGFKDIFFSPLFGEDSQFDEYFSNGLKPPPSYATYGRPYFSGIFFPVCVGVFFSSLEFPVWSLENPYLWRGENMAVSHKMG